MNRTFELYAKQFAFMERTCLGARWKWPRFFGDIDARTLPLHLKNCNYYFLSGLSRCDRDSAVLQYAVNVWSGVRDAGIKASQQLYMCYIELDEEYVLEFGGLSPRLLFYPDAAQQFVPTRPLAPPMSEFGQHIVSLLGNVELPGKPIVLEERVDESTTCVLLDFMPAVGESRLPLQPTPAA